MTANEPLGAGCAAFADLAPEFALGLLAGEDRAKAIQHLASCARCRTMLDDLAWTGDSVLAAVPGMEPKRGFEDRVLARFEAANSHAAGGPAIDALPPLPRRRRWAAAGRWIGVAAAVLTIVASVLIVSARGDSAFAEAPMTTKSGREVGEVYVYNHGAESWILVNVPGWKPVGPDGVAHEYDLRVTDAGGETTVFHGMALTAGHGAWGTGLTVDQADVRKVELVGTDGTVWCSASLRA